MLGFICREYSGIVGTISESQNFASVPKRAIWQTGSFFPFFSGIVHCFLSYYPYQTRTIWETNNNRVLHVFKQKDLSNLSTKLICLVNLSGFSNFLILVFIYLVSQFVNFQTARVMFFFWLSLSNFSNSSKITRFG